MRIEVNEEKRLVYLFDTRLWNEEGWGLNSVISPKDRKSMALQQVVRLLPEYGMYDILREDPVAIALGKEWIPPDKFLNLDLSSKELLFDPESDVGEETTARDLLISVIEKSWEPGYFFSVNPLHSEATYEELIVEKGWYVRRHRGIRYISPPPPEIQDGSDEY